MTSGLCLGWERAAASVPGPIGFVRPQAIMDHARTRGGLVVDKTDSHMVVLAPTGAGKSRGLSIPNLLHWNGSAVVIDVKGELYATTAAFRRDVLRQNIVVLDPWKQATDSPNRFNPLSGLGKPGSDPVDEARQHAHMLSPPHAFAREPFWPERAETAIASWMVYYAWSQASGARLGDIWRVMHGDVEHEIQLNIGDHEDTMPAFALSNFIGHCGTPDVTRRSIEATAQSHLGIFGSESIQQAVSETDFDIGMLSRGEGITIYICIEPGKLHSHAALIRLWLSALLNVILKRRQRPRHSTLLLLDEVVQLGPMDQIRTILTLARSYGVRAMLLAQSFGSLEKCYPDAKSLIENCGVIASFGHGSHSMSRDVAGLMGDVSADRLFALEGDELAIKQSGRETRILRRLDYLTDTLFRTRAAPNPIFGQWRA